MPYPITRRDNKGYGSLVHGQEGRSDFGNGRDTKVDETVEDLYPLLISPYSTAKNRMHTGAGTLISVPVGVSFPVV